MKISY